MVGHGTTVSPPGKAVVQGIADEDAVAVFAIGQIGRFVPDDVIDIEVTEIDRINIHELDRPYFASVYGGLIAVRQDVSGKLMPTSSVFPVRLTASVASLPDQIQRGIAVISAKPRSFARRLFDITSVLLIRGSGF
ncbi:MAG: hypothetical protein Q8N96_11090 [Methylovulum sp.]|nr:hypothetical protein [Methylovulum sp.]